MFSLSAFLAIFSPCWVVSLSLSHKRAFLAICPLAGSLSLSSISGQRPSTFMHELYLIRFAKFFFLIWLSSPFPQTNTFYCTFVFSASLAQTFVPCWVKVHFSPSRLPDSCILVSPLLESIYFSLVSPFWVDFSLSLVFPPFSPFWLLCYAYGDDTITSVFHAFLYKKRMRKKKNEPQKLPNFYIKMYIHIR